MDILKRFMPCELREINDTDRTIWFIASTDDVDRYGDVILAAGWKMDTYLKNPVFLWCHDRDELPIGKCIAYKIEANRLLMQIQFATSEENPLSEQVFRLYKGGFLSAVSVGFRALKAGPRQDGDSMGVLFQEQELLELSAVPVPANQNAVALMMKGMLDNEPHGVAEIGDIIRKVVGVGETVLGEAQELDEYDDALFVGLALPAETHDLLLSYGENPEDWLQALKDKDSAIESLKDFIDHLTGEVEQKAGKRISAAMRAELQKCSSMMEKEYSSLAKACDDIIEKCNGKLKGMLEEQEDEAPIVIEKEAEIEIEEDAPEASILDIEEDEEIEIDPEQIASMISDVMKSALDSARGRIE